MSTPTQSAQSPRLVDVPTACEYLGGYHKSTLYRMVAAHKIQPVRVTKGRMRFDVADLDRLIDKSKDRRPSSRRAA